MKQSTIDQLSWQDVQEIVTEAYLMHTIPEDLAMFETPEEQYTGGAVHRTDRPPEEAGRGNQRKL